MHLLRKQPQAVASRGAVGRLYQTDATGHADIVSHVEERVKGVLQTIFDYVRSRWSPRGESGLDRRSGILSNAKPEPVLGMG